MPSKKKFLSYIRPEVLSEALDKNVHYAEEENYRYLKKVLGNKISAKDENPVLIELKFK